MEISSFRSFAELGMDDPYFSPQWHVNSDSELTSAYFEDLHYQSYSQPPVLDFKRAAEIAPVGANRPLKQPKWISSKSENMLNYIPSNSLEVLDSSFSFQMGSNQNCILEPCHMVKSISTSTKPSQEHILSERKRREKLSMRFIALTALVPGLKKMDKASVLGDAIKYMKQLQDKVNILEEQTKKKTIESAVIKDELHDDGHDNSSDGSTITETLPEIQARFSDKHVLISILCDKQKGIAEKTFAEIERLHLSVVNSSAMSFGDSALSINVIIKKDEDFSMDVKETVKKLRRALKKFM